jgi:high-affinity iron transporter
MFATSLIVFRETLEAALFVGIVAAATRGIPGKSRWISSGVMAGLAGALLMAAGMEQISAWADGIGQDLVNIGILCLALTMLAWHCVWVSTHAGEMVREAKHLGARAQHSHESDHPSRRSSLWALSTAIALSVLREGAETVLFVAGIASGAAGDAMHVSASVSLGLLAGALLGGLIYLGLARVRTQHVFAVTNVLILALAGSLASQLAKALVQSGLIEQPSTPVWDTSNWLANESSFGTLLHALIGYDASPSSVQLMFYVGIVALIGLATRLAKSRKPSPPDAVAIA